MFYPFTRIGSSCVALWLLCATVASASTVGFNSETYGRLTLEAAYISGTKEDATGFFDGGYSLRDSDVYKDGAVDYGYSYNRLGDEGYFGSGFANNEINHSYINFSEVTGFTYINDSDDCGWYVERDCYETSIDLVFSYDLRAKASVYQIGGGKGTAAWTYASTTLWKETDGTSPGDPIADAAAAYSSSTEMETKISGRYTITLDPGDTYSNFISWSYGGTATVTPVPLPAGLPLYGSLALFGFFFARARARQNLVK